MGFRGLTRMIFVRATCHDGIDSFIQQKFVISSPGRRSRPRHRHSGLRRLMAHSVMTRSAIDKALRSEGKHLKNLQVV